jgi:hypothetical protein
MRMTNENSLLKEFLQLVTVGFELLKIHEFLSVQMLQHMIIIISIAKDSLIMFSILLTALFR